MKILFLVLSIESCYNTMTNYCSNLSFNRLITPVCSEIVCMCVGGVGGETVRTFGECGQTVHTLSEHGQTVHMFGEHGQTIHGFSEHGLSLNQPREQVAVPTAQLDENPRLA